MSYVPPAVGPAGLTIPTYDDILQDLLSGFLSIYGSNQYVGTDSAIYQFLSIIAIKMSDTLKALQFAYNQSSPATAIGTGLDRLVKLNGLARLPFGFSTAQETITGTPLTVITNGVVQDVNGNQWSLPSSVTIPAGGSIVVTVTCTTPGAVTAEPGEISIIATPVSGWASATNAAAAIQGTPVETDSQMRARQAISVALPSKTALAGTVAAIAAITGVTRYNVLENPTGSVDVYGNPPHSITAVVEGGTDLQVATAIYDNRSIGCYTNGAVSVSVTDPNTGYVMVMRFDRPTYVPIFLAVQVKNLAGLTSSTVTAIQTALIDYLNSLQIGEEVSLSALYAVAMNVTPNLANPQFTVSSLKLGSSADGIFQTAVNVGGSGYAVNDVLTLAGGTGGTVTVAAVDGGGAVTAIAQPATTPGTGYSLATGVATTGGLGTGCTVDITTLTPAGTADIVLLFNEVAQGLAANVSVISV